MFYECFIFVCVYFDDFDQLSAPVMNFVQLSATFAIALHNAYCFVPNFLVPNCPQIK